MPYWQNVLDKIKQSGKMTIYANLLSTKGVLVNDMVVGIEFPKKVTDFAKKVIEEHENKAFIEKIVSMEQGSNMQIRILEKNKGKNSSFLPIDALRQKLKEFLSLSPFQEKEESAPILGHKENTLFSSSEEKKKGTKRPSDTVKTKRTTQKERGSSHV